MLLTDLPAAIRERAAKIRLAVFDVDGVLTDGKLCFSDDGRELKSFHVHDGFGLKRLMANGIEVAVITARMSHMVTERTAELGIAHVYQGQENKLACYEQLIHALKLTPEQTSYCGDDLPDLPTMRRVGLAIAVANAHPWLREHAHWRTQHRGGEGAVREVCDLLLAAQGKAESELAPVQLMERKTLFTIIVLAVLAIGAQVLSWVLMPHDHSREFVGPPRSDYTLTNFTINALDDTGKLSFSVTGPRLAHKEDDGSVYVTTPDYVMFDNSGNQWKGKSESAWVNKDGTIMKLEGKVEMHRIPTPTVDPLQLLTTDLTVTTTPKDKATSRGGGLYGNAFGGKPPGEKTAVAKAPDTKPGAEPKAKQTRMETAALATIIDPNHIVHGVGMTANLEGLKDLEFFSDVHWIAQPKDHANTTP